MTERKLTLQEAARELGITPDALRQRLRRGQYRSIKENNRLYVWLDADRTGEAHDPTATSSALVSEMRERIASLEHQLREANLRDQENRRIVAALTQRIPELEAARADEAPDPARWRSLLPWAAVALLAVLVVAGALLGASLVVYGGP
jgi:transcriptional regulator with XRE-family HTH domain